MESVVKYTRFPSESITSLISSQDKVTASALMGKGFVLGCESGKVYVVSFAGKVLKRSHPHSRAVNAISVDYEGLFFVSCSDDCTVVMSFVHQTSAEDQTYNLGEPVKCVIMQNQMGSSSISSVVDSSKDARGRFQGGVGIKKSSDRDSTRSKKICFVAGCASGMLSRYKASWFNQVHDVLFAGTGTAVSAIAWNGGNLIAWTDASQMRVLDVGTMSAVCYLEAPDGVGVGSLFPSSLVWPSETDLYVCWADSFRHLEMKNVSTSRQNSVGSTISSDAGEEGGNGYSNGGNGADGSPSKAHSDVIARTVTEWQADFIICGISNFDNGHLALLGYAPPEQMPPSSSSSSSSSSSEFNQPEIQIVNRKTGMPLYVDALPLLGSANQGPWSYTLLSSYHAHLQEMALSADVNLSHAGQGNNGSSSRKPSFSGQGTHRQHGGDTSQQWSLSNLLGSRGGSRGLDPILYIIAPEDVVVARAKAVDDRIKKALANKELRVAAELAVGDRAGLRAFKFVDVLTLYISDLLAQQQDRRAAQECLRLFKDDPILWERWVYAFAKANKLHTVLVVMPTAAPRLPLMGYELVADELLRSATYHPRHFLTMVERWAPVKPAILDVSAMIARLEGLRDAHPYYLAALGVLYIQRQEYEMALTCLLNAAVALAPYRVGERDREESALLELYNGVVGLPQEEAEGSSDSSSNNNGDKASSSSSSSSSSMDGSSSSGMHPPEELHDFSYVFSFLESQRLFAAISNRLLALVRLDRTGAISFFLRHHDRIPVAAVVQQLRGGSTSSASAGGSGDRYALYWYLHLVFLRFPETYNTLHFAEYHALQVTLYAEHAPAQNPHGAGGSGNRNVAISPQQPMAPLDSRLFPSRDLYGSSNNSSSGSGGSGDGSDGSMGSGSADGGRAGFFLYFLKRAHLAPLELALKECERHTPPLYHEIIYIYAKLGHLEKALALLLKRGGDVRQAIDFVETFHGHGQLAAGGDASMTIGSRAGTNNISELTSSSSGHSVDSLASASSLEGGRSGQAGALWKLVVDHCLKDARAMSELLQVVGLCHLSPASVIKRLPDQMRLPDLKGRLVHLHSLRDFKSFVTDRCNDILAEDTVGLQKRLNQLQRKSVKVNPRATRCAVCSRPLFMTAAVSIANLGRRGGAGSSCDGDEAAARDPNSEGQAVQRARIWGGTVPSSNAVIVFSPKEAYHRLCYESRAATSGAGSALCFGG